MDGPRRGRVMAAVGGDTRNVFAFPTLFAARVSPLHYAAGANRTNDAIPAG
jgi:hypothetical protein